MIPRSRSIFSVGEEDHGKIKTAVTSSSDCGSGSSVAPAGACCQTRGMGSTSELQVGLKLLIHYASTSPTSGQYGWSPAASTAVVMKSSLRSVRAALPTSPSSPPPRLPELSFLKRCRRCNKELSPQKDVYIYMGDQAFCSAECRCRQILSDERREFEASFRRDQRRAADSRLRTAAAEARGGARRAGGWRRVSAVVAA